jgi:Tfp pilus assembly protein PilN
MIRINLLPQEERVAKQSFTVAYMAVGLLVLFLCAGWYGYGVYQVWSLENSLHDTANRYELLRPTQEKMQAVNAKQQQIDAKNNILLALTQERKSSYVIVTHLAAITPPQVWLTEVASAEKKLIRIKGQARTYPDLAAFLGKFEQDTMLGDPVLIKAERDTVLAATKFEITIQVKEL